MGLKKTVIIFDIVVFITVFIISGIYILFNNSFVKSPSGDYYTDVWDKKIKLTNKEKENISMLLTKNVYEVDGIEINKNTEVQISVSERHKWINGILKISGNYKEIDKIEELFNELKLIPNQDDINNNHNKVNYHPDAKNMKDMSGYINKDKNKFEISLNQDLLLNPLGLDMKLHSKDLYKIFNSANKRKIRRLIFNHLKICLYCILGLIVFNVLLYMSEKA